MSKLFELKEWLNLPDAAAHLSKVFKEDVNEADLLRLALDDQLKLSVRFVNATPAIACKTLSVAKTDFQQGLSISDRSSIEDALREALRTGREISFGESIELLSGVFDLPMIGGERVWVENKYQHETATPVPVNILNAALVGSFVEREDGELYQLQLIIPIDQPVEGIEIDSLGKSFVRMASPFLNTDEYPLVVRTSALQEFQLRTSKSENANEKTLTTRERNSLLKVIAALVGKCPPSAPMAQNLGCDLRRVLVSS